jgi:hypothetical protein
MKFFQQTGFGESKTFFGGNNYIPYMMGLGQGNRAAPPSWTQLSAIMVTVFKQLNLGAKIKDPILDTLIHLMGALFVNNTDMYTWREEILDPGEIWVQTQIEIEHWSCLLNATGGALEPEKSWWYLLNYTCEDGEWTYADIVPQDLFITNPGGRKSAIKQEEATASKKTLGIYDAPARGNEGHLAYIKSKATAWINRTANGHLPSHIAWVAYRHQLWPGLRYGLGTMTNKIEPAATLLDKVNYKTLNILGVLRNVTKGLHKIHTTFGVFGLFDLATEQLISRVNMFFQHFHVSTNLSKKLDASLGYLQLQVGMPKNPFSQDYSRWGKLATLSWVKMLWKSLHYFDITLHMSFPTNAPPWECNQVIIEIIFSENFNFTEITRINRCRVYLQTLFLLDIMTADEKYLEHFVFDPGSNTPCSRYTFLREKPTRQDWDLWVDFWHGFTTTGGKLKMPLGGWTNSTHRIWNWYYNKERDKLYHINGTTIKYFKRKLGWWRTCSTTTYQKTHEETSVQNFPTGIPTSVVETSECKVNKLQDGPLPPTPRDNMQSFWEFLATCGGTWMWDDIDSGAHSKDNIL